MSEQLNFVELAAELTVAWLSNPSTRASVDDVPAFLRSMHEAVSKLGATSFGSGNAASEPKQFTPAVSVRKSLASPDHIISLIDGKPYRALRRHLSAHGLTPDDYRRRYGLKPDYPVVAPAYGEARRELAIRTGLGRKPKPPSSTESKRGE